MVSIGGSYMGTLEEKIGLAGSFLTDEHFRDALPHIFREGSFENESVRHASYQLRLDEVKICSRHPVKLKDQKFEEFQQLKWQVEDTKEYIDIPPRKIALLYTKELFTFPDNLLGFVVSRGLLFTLGLTPETTYVDPGFSGNLYIAIVNNNENIVRLYKAMPIRRLFVFKLRDNVKDAYVAGSDMGIEQQLKQIPVRVFWEPEELKTVRDNEILESIHEGCSIGDLLTQIISRRKRGHVIHRAWLLFLSTVLLLLLLKPYFGPLVDRISLPEWLPEKLFEFISYLLAGIVVVIIERYIEKGFYRKRK